MTTGDAPKHVSARDVGRDGFRYFDFMMAAFVSILLLSNVIGAAKPAQVWGFTFGAGILFFPLSYLLGDILTEVYGYARARRCVWAGFVALTFLAFMSWVVVGLPFDPTWKCAATDNPLFASAVARSSTGTICQSTYQSVFGSTWRIVAASMTAFWVGEFVNAFVMAKMKIMTQGKYLFTRTWGSTIFGQAVDSLIFYPLAFGGVWETQTVISVMAVNWALKVTWEILLTPVTYAVVGFLKRREGVDVFDEGTDFTPFRARV